MIIEHQIDDITEHEVETKVFSLNTNIVKTMRERERERERDCPTPLASYISLGFKSLVFPTRERRREMEGG